VIELEAVTPANYDEVLLLRVAPAQEHLIAPVVKSLADAFVWGAEPRVARSAGQLVGLVLVFPFELAAEPVVNIVRLMIDHRHQGRGLGRLLIDSTIDWVATFRPRPSRLRVATFPENERALILYRTAGFQGSDIENGEVVLWRPL